MKISFKQTFIGSAVAFLLATSCCWLPWLILGIGGATGFVGLSDSLEKNSGMFSALGGVLLLIGIFQFYKKNKSKVNQNQIKLLSVITCPKCRHKKEEEMPINACQYFYECNNCETMLKPLGNDCCVFCSYGTVVCPPIQMNKDCCK